MKNGVYAILDRKLREYGHLLLARNDETMKREARDGIGPDHMIRRYPEDFDLYRLGEFENETGVLTPAEVPVLVENMSTLLGGR